MGIGERPRPYFKGIHVMGTLRLALNDHADAMAQIDRELVVLDVVTSDASIPGPQFEAIELREKLKDERAILARRFAEHYLKEGK